MLFVRGKASGLPLTIAKVNGKPEPLPLLVETVKVDNQKTEDLNAGQLKRG
jgi:hypothetical protein